MRAEPYLCLGGVELGNALRTMTYLRRGLGGSKWEVHVSHAALVGGAGYSDTYLDQYAGDPYRAADLACTCAAYDEGPYVDPATDDAPWYAAGRPESAHFLGFIPSEVRVRPRLARSFKGASLGSLLGADGAAGQVAEVRGLLVASSKAGMSFGEKWLTAATAGQLCDDDPLLSFLPACPDDGDPAQWRNLRHAGLIDDVVFTPINSDLPECQLASVALQFGAECPWLLSDATVLADDLSITSGAAQRFLVSTDAWPGDAALELRVDAGTTDMLNVRCYGQPTSGGVCPPAGTVTPCWDFTLPRLPAGHRLVVDPIDRIVQIAPPHQANVLGGLDLLAFAGQWVWPEVAPCSEVCVTLTAGTGTGGKWYLDRYDREF